MHQEDAAWAAGFFDGDGCFSNAGRYPMASIGNTDRLVLCRFKAIAGVGSISGPYERATANIRRRRQWSYQAYGEPKVGALAEIMWDWLGDARRAQATRVFERWRGDRDLSLPACLSRNPHEGSFGRNWLAWAAGFFDAEGCFSQSSAGMTARVGNTDEALVRRFLNIVRVGTIYGPYVHRDGFGGRREKWVYAASGLHELQALYAMLHFKLGKAKRDKAVSILTDYAATYRCGHPRDASRWSKECPVCFKPGPKTGVLGSLRHQLADSFGRSMHSTRIQATGQMWLPLPIRTALCLEPGRRLTFDVTDGHVVAKLHQSADAPARPSARILKRGLVTLPVDVRHAAGLHPGDLVALSADGARMIMARIDPSGSSA